MLSLKLLDRHIAECRRYVDAGNENPETLKFLLKLRKDFAGASESDWTAYNELTEHLPNEDADPVLIILKGQLLIEKLVRSFVLSRLPNPEVFEKQQFSAVQCISVAESMCLKNKEPEWLWRQVRELNGIRNLLAHNLADENIDKRISNFVSTIAKAQKLKSKSLVRAIARLYGMVKGLRDLSGSNDFSAFKI